MNKIVLFIAVACLLMSLYFFFIERNLLYGSVLVILNIAFNFIYAMLFKVNQLDDEDLKNI